MLPFERDITPFRGGPAAGAVYCDGAISPISARSGRATSHRRHHITCTDLLNPPVGGARLRSCVLGALTRSALPFVGGLRSICAGRGYRIEHWPHLRSDGRLPRPMACSPRFGLYLSRRRLPQALSGCGANANYLCSRWMRARRAVRRSPMHARGSGHDMFAAGLITLDLARAIARAITRLHVFPLWSTARCCLAAEPYPGRARPVHRPIRRVASAPKRRPSLKAAPVLLPAAARRALAQGSGLVYKDPTARLRMSFPSPDGGPFERGEGADVDNSRAARFPFTFLVLGSRFADHLQVAGGAVAGCRFRVASRLVMFWFAHGAGAASAER